MYYQTVLFSDLPPPFLLTDDLTRALYATDASVYRRLPHGVVVPQNVEEIRQAIAYASERGLGVIPRAAGTSLAGQCVGEGVVIDVSEHLNGIVSFDLAARTVTVQPGVIRDDLNRFLRPNGLFFGPNTSTSSRSTLGGMVGNNSSGTTSIRYGTTRDKIVSLRGLLADGSEVAFGELTPEAYAAKRQLPGREGDIYRRLHAELASPEVRRRILAQFPRPEVQRRNTGYAIDALLGNESFNVAKLLCGSEGTLVFTTELTVKLDPLPPPHSVMLVAHFYSIGDCLRGVGPAMRHRLYACEMLDKTILDLTIGHPGQAKNRAFLVGDPAAVLLLEVRGDNQAEADSLAGELATEMDAVSAAYATVQLRDGAARGAMELRKAGLGILGNMVGDAKAVACIEDTAVAIDDLPEYIDAFAATMRKYDQQPVYYAHAGAGELHLRPILNLKVSEDVRKFERITDEVADLVKAYGGSMSGEHGDGIVRSPYVERMIGAENYAILRRIKRAFDPAGVFNPGKIVDAGPMTANLRYEVDRKEPEISTFLDFGDTGGILRMAEKCNGTGVCRRNAEAGGTMCPSYKASRQEKHSTRGRANSLREILTHSTRSNRFDSEALKEVFDLCLSCKGCASDCPSTVDVAALKAEFQYQYRRANGTAARDKIFAANGRLNALGRRFTPMLTNFLFRNGVTSGLLKRLLGIASARRLPALSRTSLRAWSRRNLAPLQPQRPVGSLYLFIDEFTDQLDAEVGIDALQLFTSLNYRVEVIDHAESGRGYLSKGFLEEARELAERNLATFGPLVNADVPLVGIEPSAILSFRDEYPRLVDDRQAARKLAKNVLLYDEFLLREINAGRIRSEQFTKAERRVLYHGHCHQKALADAGATANCLSLPTGYDVITLPSGCCGMAGSFGYEAEHYEVSMKIGEQVLFPAVREVGEEVLLAAPGTSCRHQIKDGTAREALHPLTILRRALESPTV